MALIFLDYILLVAVIFHLFFFFFNDTATTEIYTLSLHDALPFHCRAVGTLAEGGFDLFGVPAAELGVRSEEHTSELQSHSDLVCRLLLEKKKIYYTICKSKLKTKTYQHSKYQHKQATTNIYQSTE